MIYLFVFNKKAENLLLVNNTRGILHIDWQNLRKTIDLHIFFTFN